MASYILRLRDAVDEKLWAQFKARAAQEGHALRWLLLRFIRHYVEHGLD